MKIWILQTGEPYPFQKENVLMRTGLLAQEMHSRGHDVTWWGSTLYHQRKELLSESEAVIDLGERFKVRLLHGGSYRKNVSIRRYLFHKRIARSFARSATGLEVPDIILASLPVHDLAYEAVAYASTNGVPVLIDIRDLWPDYLVNRLNRSFRPAVRLMLSSDFNKARKALSNATGLVAISEAYLQWGLGYANRKRGDWDRVFHIGCSALPEEQPQGDNGAGFRKEYGIPGDRIIVSFLGTFGETYDLDTVIAAARTLEDGGNIHFVLAGEGRHLERLLALGGGLDSVTFTGWLDRKQVCDLLRASDIGLAPYKRNAPQSLPNKPFQYTSAGMPIVSSLKGELSDMISEYDVGRTYEPESVASLVESLRELVGSRKRLEIMKLNARRLYQENFYADDIYSDFASFLEQSAAIISDRG